MRRCLAFVALSALLVLSVPAQERKPSLTGDVRFHRDFDSKFLGNKRTVAVWLPPGYASSSERYPVLYMNDGQNVFDGATSFLPNKEWRADETATALIGAGLMSPVIIVAVDNAGMSRADEYLPTRAKFNDNTFGGRADLYGRFLAEEVKPFIDKTYRTKRGPADTGLCGSSFGGVVSLHLGLTRPDVFGRIAAMSTSVWWDDRALVREVEGLSQKPALRVWLDTGAEEGPETASDHRRLRDALVKKGWKDRRDLVLLLEPRAEHNEDAWARRLGNVFVWLFPRRS